MVRQRRATLSTGSNDGQRDRSDYGPCVAAENLEYYFRPVVTWSKISTGRPRFRYIPLGFVFDVDGMATISPIGACF